MTKKPSNDALNAICPYFTMFPLEFPLGILERNAKAEQWILDPFCGRGTTNFAGRLEGLHTVGIDSNPTAIAIAQSKLVVTTPDHILATASEILEETPNAKDTPIGEFWSWAYHPEVLNIICRLREGLLKDCDSDNRKALRGIILGALHGHVMKTVPSYFSNQCQRTYSPKPAYAVRFWKKNNMQPPLVDVMAVIQKRAHRYYTTLPIKTENKIVLADSRNRDIFLNGLHDTKVDWIITSPPYYGMKSYLPDQWLRLWFLGGKPEVDYNKESQLKHTGQELFAQQLKIVWNNAGFLAKSNTRMVIRFGGIPSVKSDPIAILKLSLKDTGWKVITRHSAGFATQGRRQAYQQAKNQNPPVEEFDLWAKWVG
jgi:hypothetical protein